MGYTSGMMEEINWYVLVGIEYGNGNPTKDDILTVAHRIGLKSEVGHKIYDEIFIVINNSATF